MRGGVASLAWRLAGALLARPLLPVLLHRRARRGREVAARLAERRGRGGPLPGAAGPLLWLHAASVGETLSLLPVLDALGARAPRLRLLVTTGTVTSAELLDRRLPDALRGRVAHRFAPLDVPAWVTRFLDAWAPDAGAVVESELWPALLEAARARALPMALVNARLSARSAARWRRFAPGLAARLLGGFRRVLAQSPGDAARLRALGAEAECWGDLKDAAAPLPADPAALAALAAAVAGRPVLLGASTHPGEEILLVEAHRRLAPAHPGLLTVLVPRHPERGAEIAALGEAAGLPTARRGAGRTPPGAGTALYVADTLGELGLFYRLASVCLVGGSLVPHGGQNPREPARLGCPVLLGPHTANFAGVAAALLEAGGATRVPADADALAGAAAAVLTDAPGARAMADAAAAVAAGDPGLPDRVAAALLALLPPGAAAAAAPVAGSVPAGNATPGCAPLGAPRPGAGSPGDASAPPRG